MERPSPTTVRFAPEELRPGPLPIPELQDAGVELDIIDPSDYPDVGPSHSRIEERKRALGLGGGGPVTLILRSSDPGLEVRMVGPDGTAHQSDLLVTGGYGYRRFTGIEGASLEVTIASTLVARWSRHEAPPVPADTGGPPDWEGQLAELDAFTASIAADDDDARRKRVASMIDAIRTSILRRREAWPAEPPSDRPRPPSAETDEMWGRFALLDALEAIEAAGLQQDVTAFRPAVRAVTHPAPYLEFDQLPIGASHLHGAPHVPVELEWPVWDCPGFDPGPIEDDMWRWRSLGGPGPLTFVAQLDLGRAPLGPWWDGPSDGWLLLFLDHDRLYDSSTEAAYLPGAHRIVHVAADAVLEVRLPPWRDPIYGRWGWKEREASAGLRYFGYGYPAWVTFEAIEVVAHDDLSRAYTADNGLLPEALRSSLQDAVHRASREWHWLGGAPNPCQDDPLGEALARGLGIIDAADRDRERAGWVQLLQLASDQGTDTLWGDVGLLHVFIRSDDLAAGRFDRTLLVFQCS